MKAEATAPRAKADRTWNRCLAATWPGGRRQLHLWSWPCDFAEAGSFPSIPDTCPTAARRRSDSSKTLLRDGVRLQRNILILRNYHSTATYYTYSETATRFHLKVATDPAIIGIPRCNRTSRPGMTEAIRAACVSAGSGMPGSNAPPSPHLRPVGQGWGQRPQRAPPPHQLCGWTRCYRQDRS